MTSDRAGATANVKTKALVIDDNWDVRLLVDRVLGHADIDVSAAPGGAEGLQLLASDKLPDVILLDVQMPDMDGWTTLEDIRKDPRTADVPVIMCTVKGSPIDSLRAWQLGCDGYLAKPFEIDELLAEVRRVLRLTAIERDTVRAEHIAEALEQINAAQDEKR